MPECLNGLNTSGAAYFGGDCEIRLSPLRKHTFSIDILPTSPRVVVIDPGHGGSDNGNSYFNLREDDLVLDIALKIRDALKNSPIEIEMTRNNDEEVSLPRRIEIAQGINCDMFVSIHLNATYDGSPGSNYIVNFVRENRYEGSGPYNLPDPPDYNVDSPSYCCAWDLAYNFQRVSGLFFKANNNEPVNIGNFYVITNGTFSSTLCETCFLSNPEEATRLSTSEYRQQLANAYAEIIALAIEKYKGPEVQ